MNDYSKLVHTIWERKMRTFQTTTLIENIPIIWKRKLEKTFDFFTAWLMSALSAGGKNFHEYSAFACRGQFHPSIKWQSPKIDFNLLKKRINKYLLIDKGRFYNKIICSFGFCPNEWEEGPCPKFLSPLISAFFVNKRSIFPPKWQ